MEKLLLVGLGGGAGAVLRYLTGVAAHKALGGGWPWGTLVVNVIGGLAMGLLIDVLALRGGEAQEKLRLLLGVGVLGGFTTFSAFSLELGLMLRRQELGQAAIYAAGSVVLSVAALFSGMGLARRMFA
ncbi:fluoride efflux transporter CrcB [Phenylobacterium sp.]|jgi:CrcB protein|uniref:fluoride efflux transporter CrcB n=1 Tax=Phenylobacterium sp. TaxID=1871053 RepID=UPI002E319777|nr:fluoride efflux transporter CrcB [Phenylobacterium sp.]HEX2561760.1 fluoride efflux transporter CrcB [Phenylobacterium sp.]